MLHQLLRLAVCARPTLLSAVWCHKNPRLLHVRLIVCCAGLHDCVTLAGAMQFVADATLPSWPCCLTSQPHPCWSSGSQASVPPLHCSSDSCVHAALHAGDCSAVDIQSCLLGVYPSAAPEQQTPLSASCRKVEQSLPQFVALLASQAFHSGSDVR